jgi:hypothetical protein
MKVFGFEPADYRAEYGRQGWVHIREGVTPEFHEHLLRYVDAELSAHTLDRHAIKGKKEQSLYEFPDEVDYPDELFDVVAEVCDLHRAGMTLSERHIQAYEASAVPEPTAHKDRFPSQVSVGLSVTIPKDSRLVLYPYDHRDVNPFNRAAAFNRALQPEEHPDLVLPEAREVELDDRDRDVVMFPGSTTWHLRRRSAGAINLYFKFNDFGCDPLGEDPHTEAVRSWTLGALRRPHDEVDELVPVLGRRMDTVSRVHTRNAWEERLEAEVYGEEPFGLTELQFAVLRAVDGRRSLGTLLEHVLDGADPERARSELLRLAEQGALDLVEAGSTPPRGVSSAASDLA